MKAKHIIDALEHIDDALIADAEPKAHKMKSKTVWLRWVAVAACAVIAVGAVAERFIPYLLPKEPPIDASTPTTDDNGRALWVDTRVKNGATVTQDDAAIIWPWASQTLYEQYNYVTVDGIKYFGGGQVLSPSLVGESLGTQTATGYDEIGEQWYEWAFEAFTVVGVAQTRNIALKIADEYRLYRAEAYDPPATLGAFMDDYSLSTHLPLKNFSVNKRYSEQGYYALTDADSQAIWRMLEACRGAAFVSWEQDMKTEQAMHDTEYISFTATSQAVGAKNQVFTVLPGGYIETNICSWGYVYRIGEQAAREIIAYAKEHATLAERQRDTHALVGTVTAIAEDRLTLDDSVMMQDPADGKVFTVMLRDITLTRYITRGIIKVGDTVSVVYDGIIYADTPDLVENVYDLQEVYIDKNGDVLIME